MKVWCVLKEDTRKQRKAWKIDGKNLLSLKFPLVSLGNYESTFGLYHFSGLYHFLMRGLHHFRHGLYHFLAYTRLYGCWSLPVFGPHQFLVYTIFWSTPYFYDPKKWYGPKSGIDQTSLCGLYHFLQQQFGIDQLWCVNKSGIDQKLV